MSEPIIIVGASHAGISCADQLRKNGFSGDIDVIDRLDGLPLERPPLSKSYLETGADEAARFHLRPAEWFEKNRISLITGRSVVAIDPSNRSITLDDQTEKTFDKLVLATGATPRELGQAAGLKNVFMLRDCEDARRLRENITKQGSAVVIGGGYIGLEVAASLTMAGMKVELLEMADRLLPRVASLPISEFFEKTHRQHGVIIHTSNGCGNILQEGGEFTGVRLANNTILHADLLIVGIGVLPQTELAMGANLETHNGIVVDKRMQTSDPNIFAIGDVARRHHTLVRIESVDNAQTSAAAAAAAICNKPGPAIKSPWFWSEQFNVKLQSVGVIPSSTGSTCFVVRKGKREGGFSVWSYDESEHLAAVEAVGDAASYALGKKCLDSGLSPNVEMIADPGFDLRSYVSQYSVGI